MSQPPQSALWPSTDALRQPPCVQRYSGLLLSGCTGRQSLYTQSCGRPLSDCSALLRPRCDTGLPMVSCPPFSTRAGDLQQIASSVPINGGAHPTRVGGEGRQQPAKVGPRWGIPGHVPWVQFFRLTLQSEANVPPFAPSRHPASSGAPLAFPLHCRDTRVTNPTVLAHCRVQMPPQEPSVARLALEFMQLC